MVKALEALVVLILAICTGVLSGLATHGVFPRASSSTCFDVGVVVYLFYLALARVAYRDV